MKCADKTNIKRVIVFNISDAVWDGYKFVRLKRKYGKFERPVYELPVKENPQ